MNNHKKYLQKVGKMFTGTPQQYKIASGAMSAQDCRAAAIASWEHASLREASGNYKSACKGTLVLCSLM